MNLLELPSSKTIMGLLPIPCQFHPRVPSPQFFPVFHILSVTYSSFIQNYFISSLESVPFKFLPSSIKDPQLMEMTFYPSISDFLKVFLMIPGDLSQGFPSWSITRCPLVRGLYGQKYTGNRFKKVKDLDLIVLQIYRTNLQDCLVC